MSFAERLKAIRKKKGLTQKELADSLGIPYQGISQYERGIRQPKYQTVEKLSKALECDISELVDPNQQALIIRNSMLERLNSPPSDDSPEYTAGYKVGYAIGQADCFKDIMAAPVDPDKFRSITNNLLSLGYSINEVKLMGARLSLPKEDLEAFIQILERNRSKGG